MSIGCSPYRFDVRCLPACLPACLRVLLLRRFADLVPRGHDQGPHLDDPAQHVPHQETLLPARLCRGRGLGRREAAQARPQRGGRLRQGQGQGRG